jgi:hypothetical protein
MVVSEFNRVTRILFGAVILCFAASASSGCKESYIVDSIPINQCIARGGWIESIPSLTCIVNYPDAGNPCTRSADCKGNCIHPSTQLGSGDEEEFWSAQGRPKVGDKTIGVCESSNSPYFTRYIVDDGRVQSVLQPMGGPVP